MHATFRFKVAIFKHFFRFTASHSFCSSIFDFAAHANRTTLNELLNRRPPLLQLKQVHAQVIAQSLSSHSLLIDSLIHCYLSTNSLAFARTLFDRYPSPCPPLLLWNIVIRSYSRIPYSPEPITLFRRLNALEDDRQVVPDKYTFTFLITSCAHQTSELPGMIVHGMVVKNGYLSNLYIGNSMISLYGGFCRLDDACKVFDEMRERDVFSWTSLMRGYAKQGDMDTASEIFATMPLRNEVSWAVTISGFLECGRSLEALKYFHDMLREDHRSTKPNEAVLVCALSACVHLGALDQAKQIHTYIIKNIFSKRPNIMTALIDTYAKCGSIDAANRVFHTGTQPDVCNYTSMISGFASHGQGIHALHVFDQMLAANVAPNDITLLGVLKGCSHSGLVDKGCSIFRNMESSWGIAPNVEHYGCFVDLLSRSGRLKMALVIALKMPVDADTVVWRSLLSACSVYKDVKLADKIVGYLEKGYCGCFDGSEVLLSNIYASFSRWESVNEVRQLMQVKKTEPEPNRNPGCSWIEVEGVVHEFRVDDQLHPLRATLDEVLETMCLNG